MLPIADVDVVVDHLDKLDKLDHATGIMSGGEWMGMVIAVVAIVVVFGTPIVIVLAMLRQRTTRQKLINDVVLKLADKGHPIPPELFAQAVRERSDLRRSVLWMAAGAGIVLYGLCSWDTDVMGVGFIPLMIGVGFFVAARLEQKQKDAG
ncbi:MAG: hypothetical protein ISP90_10045 [Nevskia sp.]|nr:hypothetical protein [Nevskia sp.]